MEQRYTSANTSINKDKLPALYNKVDFMKMATRYGLTVLDWGCGKYDNGKQFIEDMGYEWYGYDKYNRSEEENHTAWVADWDCILCSNVLNVIDSEAVIADIANAIMEAADFYCLSYFISVYEGDKSGNGRETKIDCYQRNQRTRDYLKFFPGAVIVKGVITNAPEFVK